MSAPTSAHGPGTMVVRAGHRAMRIRQALTDGTVWWGGGGAWRRDCFLPTMSSHDDRR
jgi:hypothetical protein